MRVHHLHQALHELFVVALWRRRLHALALLLGTRVLPFQSLARANQTVHRCPQLRHVERLVHISVGALLQTFQAVGDIGLRREHHYGNVQQVHVRLNHAQHREAIHLRHHHIAHHEVVVVREQLLQRLLTISADAAAVVVSQLRGDVVSQLQVVVDDEHAVLIAGRRRCCCRFHAFLFLQVSAAQRYCHHEARAVGVGSVVRFDGAVMEVHNHLAEVQADARSSRGVVLRVTTLIEAVEDVLQRVVVDAHAVVGHLEACRVARRAQRHRHVASVAAVFECVAQQICQHLVELVAVHPCLERADAVVVEREVDVSLLGVIVEHLAHPLRECHEVGGLTVQVHLLLVNLTNVENLVHEVQDAVGVVLNGVDVAHRLLLSTTAAEVLLQLGQRTHDERQRRPDVVRGVDEELHLLLVHQAARATTVGDGGASQYQQEQQGIEQASQRGAIPRSQYRHLNQFRGRVGTVGQCSHLYIVGAGLQLAQRDGVRAVVGVQPRSFVDAIFEGNVRGVGEVQLREHQCECVVAIRQPELVAQRHRLLRDVHAVELRKRVHRHTFHDEIREQQGIGLLLHRLDGGGHERGQTVVGAEEDAVALRVQAHPIEVFAVVQAVAVHVADEAVLLAVVLPDAHRRGTPQVAVGSLHDVADGLVA